MAAPAVLGMSAVRPPFLDDIRIGSRDPESRGASTRHTRGDDGGADRSGAGREHPAQVLTWNPP